MHSTWAFYTMATVYVLWTSGKQADAEGSSFAFNVTFNLNAPQASQKLFQHQDGFVLDFPCRELDNARRYLVDASTAAEALA